MLVRLDPINHPVYDLSSIEVEAMGSVHRSIDLQNAREGGIVFDPSSTILQEMLRLLFSGALLGLCSMVSCTEESVLLRIVELFVEKFCEVEGALSGLV